MEKKKKLNIIISGILCGILLSLLFQSHHYAYAASAPALDKKAVTISVGQTVKINVKNVKSGQKISWQTGNKAVVTVSNGTIKGIKAGNASISAKVAGKTQVCKVTVKQPALNVSNITKPAGAGYLNPIKLKNYTGGSITWSTNDNTKATAVHGKSPDEIYPYTKFPGRYVYTAKYFGKTYKCTVNVYRLNTTSLLLPVGMTEKLYFEGYPNFTPHFESNDKRIATVDPNTGVVKGITKKDVRINVYDKKDFQKNKFRAKVIERCMVSVTDKSQKVPMSAKEKQAYNKITALKSKYYEGMKWTNKNAYTWNVKENGKNVIHASGGCYAFAQKVSDIVFGKSTPVKKIKKTGGKLIGKVKVGDIVVLGSGYHAAVVLEKETDTLVLVEGNYAGCIHWRRRIHDSNADEIKEIYTRY